MRRGPKMPKTRRTQERPQRGDSSSPALDSETPSNAGANQQIIGEDQLAQASASDTPRPPEPEEGPPIPQGVAIPVVAEEGEETILDRHLADLERQTQALRLQSKRARIAQMRAEVARLEQDIAGEAPVIDVPASTLVGSSMGDTRSSSAVRPEDSISEVAPARHKRVASAVLPSHVKRTKLEPLRKFKGDTLASHREFIRDCNLHFEQSPYDFPDDRAKVLHAMGALEGDARSVWYTYYEQEDRPALDWTFFQDFLRDIVAAPAVREMDVKQKYTDARQEPAQSVRKFDVYLASLEAQMEEFSELQRRDNFFTRLNKKLQLELTRRGEIPVTRAGIVSAAALLEDVDNQAKGAQGKAPERHQTSRPRRHRSPSRGHAREQRATGETPAKSSSDQRDKDNAWKKNLECYGCGRKGHIKPECPYAGDSSGQKAKVHQVAAKVAGKGRASRKAPEKPETGAR